jgi:dCMP deaminase
MSRPAWHETWLDIAAIMSRRSLCTRRQVGAVLVKDDRIISTGYNGTPPKQKECFSGGCPRGSLTGPLPEDYSTFECWALHAEANALLRAGSAASGATLYCTHRPCPQCQNLIMGAQVHEVFWGCEARARDWWHPPNGRLG